MALLSASLLILATFVYLGFTKMKNEPLKVMFPVSYLKEDVSLLDPENTNSVWEYYLLENLSCGLVRDSHKSALGYEGCLAEKFYQENPQTWVFYLRNLKWSNGKEISSTDINQWINNLRFTPHRHIQFMPKVNKFHYDPMTRKLIIEFPHPMDHSILHELSLADACLLPPNYKIAGWNNTVGPYFVENWDSKNRVLRLTANTYSPLFQKEMPEKVILENVLTNEEKEQLFSKIPLDIVPAAATTDPLLISKYQNQASQAFNAHHSSILFLFFNYSNSLTHELNNRLRIAEILENIRHEIPNINPKESNFLAESQLIPNGFNGHINNLSSLPISNKHKIGSNEIKLRMPIQLKFFPDLLSALSEQFLKNGLTLKINFESNFNLNPDEFGMFMLFVGNQQDSSGSWSFLLGPPLGPLNSWLPKLRKEFDALITSKNWTDRLSASKELHKKILSDVLAFPILIGHHRYFLSSRVDASSWNKLDSRLRFYELRFK